MAPRPPSLGFWIAALTLALVSGCAKTGSTPAPRVERPEVKGADPKPEAREPLRPTIAVSPASLQLKAGDVGYQLLVDDSAKTEPQAVSWRAEPEGIIAVSESGYVRPIASGKAIVKVTTGSAVATVPVEVEVQANGKRAWSFDEDVVPILTRAGCNAGSCHGRAAGQNGFHLSFLGYDPESDHRAITRDAQGRRIARLRPESSLLLGKATGQVPHAGGLKLTPGSVDYQTLLDWLQAGAPRSSGKTHGRLVAIAIEPAVVRLDAPGPKQIRVVGRYADGHLRDVTHLASFRINDDSTLSIDASGMAVLLRRGEADLVVRYQSEVVSARLSAVVNPDLDLDFARLKRRNFLDDLLYARLDALKVPPSPTATDAVFLRRASLDLTGEQPRPDAVRQFLADSDPEKRVKLVDRLIASADFVRFWEIKLGDLLQISSARFGNGAAYYHTWLNQQIGENRPWDQSVRTLLTALGNPMIFEGGPVNYALDGPDAQTQAEQTAQRFLGLRLRCAQCHDHPFDVWTQDDYYGLAAFFAKVQRGGGPGRTEVKLNPKGTVEHLRTKQVVTPRLPGGTLVHLAETDDPRKALADWMTAPDNPYFARAMANWVWAQFFGKGLADPADDLSRSNPPVHPELLDALARHFVDHKFDLRDLIRAVAVSEAYGLSSATIPGNEKDNRLFSHQTPRPLSAHQMADALAQATDVPNRFPNKPPGTRAIEVYDPATVSTILDTFGRCARTVGCASVSTPPLSLRQSLLLIGGDVIESKVNSLDGYLANLLELNPEPDEIVENLYLRVVCRPPSAEELSRWSAELSRAKSRGEASEDLFWALLNSREFAFNH